MSLQASDDGGENEKEENQSSHGSNLALGEDPANSGKLDALQKKTAIPNHRSGVGLFRNLLFTLLCRKITF